ncbi:MAG: hypothetical protein DHS20C19_08870 [Acidimicrobiales bacterium]|nr:MAG: hypothetical protein DHS20C19_08870 [Acidimicrobiales bacterium]
MHSRDMSTNTFLLEPISAADAEHHRVRGGTVHIADSHPGYPCRRCLEDAPVGEELILVSHDPFDHATPYRSASPIFLHRASCDPPEDLATFPVQLTRRRLSVRAFDDAALMTDAAVVDGEDLGAVVDDFLSDGAVTRIHVHNADRGCWAVTITRPPDS